MLVTLDRKSEYRARLRRASEGDLLHVCVQVQVPVIRTFSLCGGVVSRIESLIICHSIQSRHPLHLYSYNNERRPAVSYQEEEDPSIWTSCTMQASKPSSRETKWNGEVGMVSMLVVANACAGGYLDSCICWLCLVHLLDYTWLFGFDYWLHFILWSVELDMECTKANGY